MKEKILSDFNSKKENFQTFKEKLKHLIIDLLTENSITIHQITGRVKSDDSISKKVDKKNGKYNDINDITDIVGIRIITYLDSDVDVIANLISNEFKIDRNNSIDKRILDADQFGYRSLHYVISLNNNRASLSEYKSYKNIKCEIQIRSILQHAWAEIEHDLGYKGKAAVPDRYIRDFNRLAALLETADKEFDRLKQELTNYEKEIPKLIKEKPQTVEINQASISSLLDTNQILKNAKKVIQKNTKVKVFYTSNINDIIERFEFFEIQTIKELEDSIHRNQHEYLAFVNIFTTNVRESTLPASLPLFYFQHFLASQTEDIEKIEEYFNSGEAIIKSPDSNDVFAQEFIDLYRMIKKR